MKTKYVKKVLMCRPDFFSVEYVINPWMIPGSVDRTKALEQWHALVEIYRSLSIKVEHIAQLQHLPDMVFSADQAIILHATALMSNFKYRERRGERPAYQDWFAQHNFTIQHLPQDHYFEGTGECLIWNNRIFIGVGFRTKNESCALIASTLNMEVIPLELVNPQFYHLDTCFFPLNNKVAFYYPEAFSPESREQLQKHIPHLIPFSNDEAYGFCANSIATDHHVVLQKGNQSFKARLEKMKYKVVEADVSEFIKAGGGIHCLTNVVEESYE